MTPVSPATVIVILGLGGAEVGLVTIKTVASVLKT